MQIQLLFTQGSYSLRISRGKDCAEFIDPVIDYACVSYVYIASVIRRVC